MTRPTDQNAREERLAAKLRENLRRRKAQSRALARPADPIPEVNTPKRPLPKDETKS